MAALLMKILIVLVGFQVSSVGVRALDLQKMISRTCNGDKYQSWDYCYDLPREIVNDLVDQTPDATLYELYITKTYYDCGLMYGHGYCYEGLSPQDCQQCMQSAKNQLWEGCNYWALGAQIQLFGCRIRYENYTFHNDG
ncbi:hypothetical protein MLD38_022699 [Melastoma candidum]|uniref:Uncharacterized protein n=1 Tax=Melastoma candidum TaxID=119954 RepID=A0ACB9QLC2_9MYRT|nr:hypothetical protein MLD38_022699 [Melastoma candidum]